MKLLQSYFPLLLLLLVMGVRGQDARAWGDEENGVEPSASCVFDGCTCSDEGEYEAGEENDTGDNVAGGGAAAGAEEGGTDIRCKLDDNTSNGGGQQTQPLLDNFPHRLESDPHRIITSLDMSALGLTSVPADRFAQLEISVADLGKNSIREISENAFRGIVKLDVLELSTNQISNIHDATFQPVERMLIQLSLKYNKLNQMDTQRLSNIFSRFSSLRSLALDHNELGALPNLSKMSKLEDVSLSNNKLETLNDPATGEQLLPSKVQDLQLSNNRFKHITRRTFEGLNQLKYLYLDTNQIQHIDNDAFSHLTQLRALYLSKNYIRQIPTRAFYSLVNLDRLDLSNQNQQLREIEDFAFDRQSNSVHIRKVDLSKNRIAKLGNKAFCSKNKTHPYANVKDIDLAGNQLINLYSCVFRQMSKGYDDYRQGSSKQQPHHQHQAQPKSRVNLKLTSLVDKLGPNLKCDCEVTKASFFVDLDGDCENSAGVLVPLSQFKCNSDILYNLDYIESDCQSRPEFNCLLDTPPQPAQPSHSGSGGSSGSGGGGGGKRPITNDQNVNSQPNSNQATKQPITGNSATSLSFSRLSIITTLLSSLLILGSSSSLLFSMF